jgi:hypothetical protein
MNPVHGTCVDSPHWQRVQETLHLLIGLSPAVAMEVTRCQVTVSELVAGLIVLCSGAVLSDSPATVALHLPVHLG